MDIEEGANGAEGKDGEVDDSNKDDSRDMKINLNHSHDNANQEKTRNEFINLVNEDEVLKIDIWKLKPNSDVELIWSFQKWVEYNKLKTGQIVKNITRKKNAFSSEE